MADRVLFANKPCLFPTWTAQSILDTTYPLDPDIWKATRFSDSLGLRPAEGWILMRRNDLTAATLIENVGNTLSIQSDGQSQLNFLNLCIVGAKRLTPGKATDKDAFMLVQIADRGRYQLQMMTGYAATPNEPMFNLPSPVYTSTTITNYADSQNAGTDYTWQGMWDKLWPTSIMGTSPTLPYTPHLTPYGFDFRGFSILEALETLCIRLGVAVRYKPSTGTYDLVEIGKTDATTTAAITANAKSLIEDDEPLCGVKPLIPYGVRVRFHKWATQSGSENVLPKDSGQWATSLVKTEERTAPSAIIAKADSNLYCDVWDDLPALVDPYALTVSNQTDVTARADERRDKLFQVIGDPGDRMRKIYDGAQNFQLGSRLTAISWRQGHDMESHVDDWDTEIAYWPGIFASKRLTANTHLHPPMLAVGLPVYPPEDVLVLINAGPDGSGYYDATEKRYNPATGTYTSGIAMKVRDPNGS
jgi:hypothetical protein